ncbi:hypothetical protein NCS57_01476100 [Fusarium keratoplasticum]|uniref:Uncharacterized protein n=1 Tax=Fusarium keratoplasticum TaxID=1328300 RepID=A0ACC0QCB0_9HYPO|nr:hypothetical protein NCS57_01476100 [Fusarium keratoplasticum]KAI8648644.1 hypothetical protein NCS57_01476100 [Fusarium keratoplasticum]
MTLEKKKGMGSHEPKPTPPRAGPDNGSTGHSDLDPKAAPVNTSPDEQPKQQLSAFKGLGLLDPSSLPHGESRHPLALAWAFLPDKPELRTGLILVGLGRCIAMVLIWNSLAGGSDEYCAILVAINSILQMVLFAPLAIFFIRVISHESGTIDISYSVVATSVAVFLGIPLGAAIITRFVLRKVVGPDWYQHAFLKFLAP